MLWKIVGFICSLNISRSEITKTLFDIQYIRQETDLDLSFLKSSSVFDRTLWYKLTDIPNKII